MMVLIGVAKNQSLLTGDTQPSNRCLGQEGDLPFVERGNLNKDQQDRYEVLAASLQRLSSNYTKNIIPIVPGSTGYIPKSVAANLIKLWC